MVAVANCISGPADFGNWIADSFRDTFRTLDEVSGVDEFLLWRLGGEHEHCLYVSVTAWRDLSDFERWRTSPQFVAAHPDRDTFSEEFKKMNSIRYNIEVSSAVAVEPVVRERLLAEHPELISDDPFIVEVEWARVSS